MADPYEVGKRYGSRGSDYMSALSGFEMEKTSIPTREEANEVARGVKDGKRELAESKNKKPHPWFR